MKCDDTVRTGKEVCAIKQAIIDNLTYVQGKFSPVATLHDYYMALAYTVRDHVMESWHKTAKTYFSKASRTVCYFSVEYLLGPQLGNNMINLGIYDNAKKAVNELGLDFDELLRREVEPGLGSGGLGRLAACYMDSLATLSIPAIGYGVRYEFGIFKQEIHDGWQIESTDKWLRYGNPWEISRPEIAFDIKFGGHTESYTDDKGRYQVKWVPSHVVKSLAYDMLIIGYRANTANFLRLWKAEACESFDFQAFNVGNYYRAVEEKVSSENITKILYPNDEPLVGKKLRLYQQYFFASSSLQDMIRIFQQKTKDLTYFADKYAVQLNDTHPVVGIPELMRLLVDEYQIGWDKAWEITQKTFSYTNHTLMPEALEKWPLPLFASVLPRHLEIILEINHRFTEELRQKYQYGDEKIKRLSIIEEHGEKYVRMAHLACVGCHSINGVSELHSELIKNQLLHDFYELWPKKFTNVTNGITPRRFLLHVNPELASVITDAIGDTWIKKLADLRNLEKFADDTGFQDIWRNVKKNSKIRLAKIVQTKMNIKIDPMSIFDIQAKRIHEYKRQHLNILHVITLYNRLRNNPNIDIVPRTVFFAGKAAPGYFLAKLIIKLINSVAEMVNNDPLVKNRLKVVFLANYNLRNAYRTHPAADLSEQISTAGREASGTGNMKFSLNGALTIGTLDGANIEIREEVGSENFFLFGLNVNDIANIRARGYNPASYIAADPELDAAIKLINSGFFSKGDKNLFRPLTDSLLFGDEYMVCADYRSYIETQDKVNTMYKNKQVWTRASILNVARMGKFSSDRAIIEYCEKIWNIFPVVI